MEWEADKLRDVMLQGERLVWGTNIKTYTMWEQQYNTNWKDRNVYFTTSRILWDLGPIPKEIRYSEISATEHRTPGSGGFAGVSATAGGGGVILLRSTRASASFQFQDKQSLDYANWLINEGMRGVNLKAAEGVPEIVGHRDPNAPPPPPPAQSAGGCFIATAVYGEHHTSLDVLRRYRDAVLQRSIAGRIVVRCYYFSSPPIARFVGRTERRRSLTRQLMDPIVRMAGRRL